MNTLTTWSIILIILIIIVMIFWFSNSYSYKDLLENNFYLTSNDYLNIGYDEYGNVFTDDINHIRQKPTKVFYTENKSVKVNLDETIDEGLMPKFTIIFTDANGLFIDKLNDLNNLNNLKRQTNLNEYVIKPYSYFFIVFSIYKKSTSGSLSLLTIQPDVFNLIKKHLKFIIVDNTF